MTLLNRLLHIFPNYPFAFQIIWSFFYTLVYSIVTPPFELAMRFYRALFTGWTFKG